MKCIQNEVMYLKNEVIGDHFRFILIPFPNQPGVMLFSGFTDSFGFVSNEL